MVYNTTLFLITILVCVFVVGVLLLAYALKPYDPSNKFARILRTWSMYVGIGGLTCFTLTGIVASDKDAGIILVIAAHVAVVILAVLVVAWWVAFPFAMAQCQRDKKGVKQTS